MDKTYYDIYSELRSSEKNEIAMITAKIKKLKESLTERQLTMLRFLITEVIDKKE